MRVLALDPGTHTGWALWDTDRFEFHDVCSMAVHHAIWMLDSMKDLGTAPALVIFEDARLRKYFAQADKDEARAGAARREGAGAAKRDATIWDDYLTDVGIPFLKRKPMGTKRSAEEFRRLSKWDKPTNEHGRDAGMLVLQLNTPGAKQMLAEAMQLREIRQGAKKQAKRATA